MRRRDEYLKYLASVPMFRACSQKELELVARTATSAEVPAGRVLCKEDTWGTEFFVIVDGEAKVERAGTQVDTLEPGDYFGELAVLANIERNATITALTDMEVFVIPQGDFASLLDGSPAFARKLLHGMALRLSELDRLNTGH